MTTTATRLQVPSVAQQSWLSHRRIMIIYSGLMLGMLLASLDQTII